jgi:hypothetical protein
MDSVAEHGLKNTQTSTMPATKPVVKYSTYAWPFMHAKKLVYALLEMRKDGMCTL